ncbi:MAG: hypothetical protein IJU19_05010 [Bacteroidales bacterium]|nr:hypothetical protein [Bacteroidales bacterium]
MVAPRPHLLALACLLTVGRLAAQNFSPSDTLTQYPHYGTYYHDRFVGRKTASGEIFDQNKFTAAHWKIKLGTLVLVTNRNTGLQVIVKINDRCPKHGVLDLTHRAATAIGIRGCQPVTVRIIPPSYEARWHAQEPLFDSVKVAPQRNPSSPAAPKTPPTDTTTAAPTTSPAPQAPNAHPTPTMPAHKTTTTTHHQRCCAIQLGTAQNHAEAYEKIHLLPEYYQSSVSVETIPETDLLLLTLDVSLPADKARALSQALLHNFPDNTVSYCD